MLAASGLIYGILKRMAPALASAALVRRFESL